MNEYDAADGPQYGTRPERGGTLVQPETRSELESYIARHVANHLRNTRSSFAYFSVDASMVKVDMKTAGRSVLCTVYAEQGGVRRPLVPCFAVEGQRFSDIGLALDRSMESMPRTSLQMLRQELDSPEDKRIEIFEDSSVDLLKVLGNAYITYKDDHDSEFFVPHMDPLFPKSDSLGQFRKLAAALLKEDLECVLGEESHWISYAVHQPLNTELRAQANLHYSAKIDAFINPNWSDFSQMVAYEIHRAKGHVFLVLNPRGTDRLNANLFAHRRS